jgi:hypothetical protein
MSKKLLKKLKDKEEKLMDAIYEIQELLDSTEDAELSSIGDTFSEIVIDFINSNDTLTLNDIKKSIEESE